ncbi:hypothetical protein CD351_12905 [Erythrobacter sp. KY5]|uniref:sel1 repeat family protein n=1 Tax=Erythrobacter sp. KY5 TaxID=2011159 RepID=UPI000DBF0282|nr:sel1 repeat family protein [Erythrobacter sp. KY5]AWW75328.1 hypothetical protein CD351_12905 [Erythrobacter sp. KY5]
MASRLLLLLVVFTVSACSGRYLGIDRASLDPAAQVWLDRAQAGDKQAQFDLGMRYVRGDGVPQDCEAARRLLRRAATRTGGTIWVYSPPVTTGGSGRVIPVDGGPVQPGLQTAEEALARLNVEGGCPKT